jgi:alkylation response protein AidB-like acyl-CoA dehydrogenase
MIDLLPSVEQQQIIDSVVEFFERALPVARPAGADSGRISAGLWKEIAGLGWFGLGLAEQVGGAGYCLVEEMLVAREIGRHVASPALFAAMLAAHVAANAGNEPLLERILSGELRVGLANLLPGASRRARNFHLLDADGSHLVLYWDEGGMGLHERASFATATAVDSLDEAVHLERAVAPDSAPFAWVSAQRSPLPRRAALLICAQQVGVAEAAKDDAVAYAKMREQFGQPIGAFQALKHECADMAVECEAAYAQTFFAGLTENDGLADAGFQCAAAGLLATQAALGNARANIQIHGGIGFTSECDAHRYLKRAHLLAQLGGAAGRHWRLLVAPSSDDQHLSDGLS